MAVTTKSWSRVTGSTTATNSITLSPPEGTQAGDALVISVSANAASGNQWDTPDGWTWLHRNWTWGTYGTFETRTFARIVEDPDEDVTVTLDGAARIVQGVIACLSGTAPVNQWVVGPEKGRDDAPSESLTTTVFPVELPGDDCFVLTVAFERTTANETSVEATGAEEWFFSPQEDSTRIVTFWYGTAVASGDLSDQVVITYPNPQDLNGWGFQIAIPSQSEPEPEHRQPWSAAYVGSVPVRRAYVGSQLIWESESTVPEGFVPFYSTNFATNDGWTARQETQSNDDSYNTPDNVSYGSEGLIILGKRESRGGRDYTTGDVLGQHVDLPSYFYIEVDATLPTDYGMWTCPLWLRPNSVNNDGEIDLCETWTGLWDWDGSYTTYSNAVAQTTIHRDYTTGNKDGGQLPYSVLPNPDAGARHTYACLKTEGRLEILVDGYRIRCWQRGASSNPSQKLYPTPSWYDEIYEVPGKSWYPRVTLQIGGNWSPLPRPEWQESRIQIHALRAYVSEE